MNRRVLAVFAAAVVFHVGGAGVGFAADPTPAPSPATQEGPSGADIAGGSLRGALNGLVPGLGAAQALRGVAGEVAKSPAGQAAAEAVVGDRCKVLPTVGTPTDGLAGRIDAGPSRPGSGMYSTYGWGGLAPVIHDPGCPVGLDLSTAGMQKRIADPANATAGNLVQAQVTMLAASTQAAQVVLEPAEGAWAAIAPLTSFVRFTLGWRAWWWFFAVATAATALWFAYRAPRGDSAQAREKSWKAAVILAAGAATLAVPVTAGALVSHGVTAVYQAMSTGTADSAGQSGASADAAIGDVLFEQVAWPTWVDVHFGDDQAAASKYGQRLFAAGAVTRDEQARAAADPGYAQQLDAAKKADYLAVAAAYKAEYPATYERTLAGVDTSERPWKALLGAVGAFPAAYFLLWTLFWAGAARLALELVVAFTPAAALVVQFPSCQWIARAAVGWLSGFFVTAFAAIVVYVAFTVGVVGGILSAAGLSTMAKFGWMLAILLVARTAWRRGRKRLYAATGAERSARTGLGLLRQILRELRVWNRRGNRGDATADGQRQETPRRASRRRGAKVGEETRETPAPAPAVTEPIRAIPAEEQTPAPAPVVVKTTAAGPVIRHLPSPVDATSPRYAPRVNIAPPDPSNVTGQVRADRARLVQQVTATVTRKEVNNVFAVASRP